MKKRLAPLIGRNVSAVVPPGFDPDQYYRINPDVASTYDGLDGAARHYRHHGSRELRTLMPEGQGIFHPASRVLKESLARKNWREELAKQVAITRGGLEAVLRSHPRAAWLETAFNLGSYLVQWPDVMAEVSDPREAAFHFLEIGLEEGRYGRPGTWDPEFVRHAHKISLPETSSAVEVLAALRAHGADPLSIVLNEEEYWSVKGYCGSSLQKLFDHEYYHAVASRLGMPPVSETRICCIDHFIEVGIAALLPISDEMEFSPKFYREQFRVGSEAHEGPQERDFDGGDKDGIDFLEGDGALPSVSSLPESTSELYRHWLGKGISLGLWPNLQSWGSKKFDLEMPPSLLSLLPVYQLHTYDLPHNAPLVTVLWHLINHPRPALAALPLDTPEMVEFVACLADRTAVDGRDELAEWLYWLALEADAKNERACRHLADLLQRRGRSDIAVSLRQRLPGDADTGWNKVGLAEIFMKGGRLARAAEILVELRPTVRGDVVLREKTRELARECFERIWSGLGDYVAAYGVETTNAHLKLVLEACTPVFSSAERSREVRHVALVGNEDLFQCKLYRVDQKAEQLRSAGYQVTIFSPSRDMDTFQELLSNFEAVVFFRVPAFPKVIEAIAAAAQQGVLTFYEIDDLVFDPTHFPPAFETYAGQIERAHYDAMACGVPLFEHAMRLCDYGIASTGTIRELMEKQVRTGRVFEHRNALGNLHMFALKQAEEGAKPARPSKAPLVIFYGSGTRAHKEDFHEILEPALAHLLRKYPGKVEVRLIGHFGEFRHLDPTRSEVRIMEPVWDFEEYCARLAEADINLSVLTPTLLTDAKSEIKWMEAAMFAIPSVVSNTAGHREVIADGETGLLCNSKEDFTNALSRLVEDGELRKRIGSAARTKVMTDYSLETMGENLRRIFETLRPASPNSEGTAPAPAKAKHRLLVVNVFYPPQAIGGATRVVHDNVALLRDRYGDQFEIDVICTVEGGRTPYEVEVHAEGGVRVWGITADPAYDDMAPRDPRMADVFGQLVERLSPDLVHFHCIQRLTASVVDVARHRRIPYVITLHDGWWISPQQFLLDEKGRVETYNYDVRADAGFPDRARALWRPLSEADQLLAVSESFAELHRGCGLQNVGVNENGLPELPHVERRPSQNGRVRLAHIGGATRHKGLHLVRAALEAGHFEHLELLLIDHSLPRGTTKKATWGTTPVTITGKVPQARVAELYGNIDVLLAPSTWPESYGLVTREAEAAGVWVIASNMGAIGADVVEGETGHVVDVSGYGGVLEALRKVEAEPERYRSLVRSRPLRGVADQVDELVQVYEGLLAVE